MKTSSLFVTDLVTKWARHKFREDGGYWLDDKHRKALNEAVKFEIEQETRSGGYCETCWYEYVAVVVYAVDANGTRIEIYEDSDASLVDLMQEILEASEKWVNKD